jgi:hypothetical protein
MVSTFHLWCGMYLNMCHLLLSLTFVAARCEQAAITLVQYLEVSSSNVEYCSRYIQSASSNTATPHASHQSASSFHSLIIPTRRDLTEWSYFSREERQQFCSRIRTSKNAIGSSATSSLLELSNWCFPFRSLGGFYSFSSLILDSM